MKKSIIITGAGRGIGAATARMFLDNGYRVGLIGRNADTLAATADGHPNALVLPCDVGVPEEVQTSFDARSTNGDGSTFCSTMRDAAVRPARSTRPG